MMVAWAAGDVGSISSVPPGDVDRFGVLPSKKVGPCHVRGGGLRERVDHQCLVHGIDRCIYLARGSQVHRMDDVGVGEPRPQLESTAYMRGPSLPLIEIQSPQSSDLQMGLREVGIEGDRLFECHHDLGQKLLGGTDART